MASSLTKTILVTGGTAGLGYQCALQLAKKFPNYQVIIASRSDHNGSANTINEATGQKNTVFLPLDLSSLATVRQFVATYVSKDYPPIIRLFMNAGTQFAALNYSNDGFEKTFAVNHAGPALLFFLLRDYLDDNAYIILTASGTHDPAQKTGMPDAIYESAELLAHPAGKALKYPGTQRYSTSKLCNVLWMYALDRKLQAANEHGKKNWKVIAFDPGLMPGTGLLHDANSIARFVWKWILPRILPLMRFLLFPNIHTTQESGANLAELAMMDGVSHGKYFEGLREIKTSDDSYSLIKQEDLWNWTLNNITSDPVERAHFDQF